MVIILRREGKCNPKCRLSDIYIYTRQYGVKSPTCLFLYAAKDNHTERKMSMKNDKENVSITGRHTNLVTRVTFGTFRF